MNKIIQSLKEKKWLLDRYYHEKEVFRKQVTPYFHYFKAGYYRFVLANKTIVYRCNDPRVQKYIKNHFSTNTFALVLSIFGFPMRINGTTKRVQASVGEDYDCFSVDLAIKTITEDYRLFDFDAQLVLTLYTKEKAIDIEEKYRRCPFYINPFLKRTDNGLMERFTEGIPKDDYSSDDKAYIISRVYADTVSMVRAGVSKQLSGLDENMNAILPDSIQSFEKELLNLSYSGTIPLAFCHGDLTIDNIIYTHEDFYYIDFEYSHADMFYYDWFTFVFFDDSLLEAYITAEETMMEQCSELFSAAKFIFSEKDRLKYMYRFLYARFIFLCKTEIWFPDKEEHLTSLMHTFETYIHKIKTIAIEMQKI